jgi:hypothetical protein
MEIRNMENMNGRAKKQRREEPDRVIGVEGRRKAWSNWELMKYYSHKAVAGSSNDLKRYDCLFSLEKTLERGAMKKNS